MNVQYRATPIVLTDQLTAIAAGDANGVLLVSPVSPTPATFNEQDFKTGGASGYAVSTLGPQVPFILTKIYVGLPSPLVGVGPYYVVMVDKVGAIVAGERSIIPTPKMQSAGELYFWEPPGGVKFSAGMVVALSSTPLLYTAVLEQCSVSGWGIL